ncbi:hypothetical protein SMATCC274_25770 [Serratia marcescens]|nr:hypothetical protein SMATCC274_25770 [Serratia marcescens]
MIRIPGLSRVISSHAADLLKELYPTPTGGAGSEENGTGWIATDFVLLPDYD